MLHLITLIHTHTRQRPLPDNTQHTQETDIHDTDKNRTHNTSRPAAADPRLRTRSYRDRLIWYCYSIKEDLWNR